MVTADKLRNKILKKRFWRECIKCRYLFLLLLPVVVYYVIFYYVPMYGAIIAWKEFNPTKGIWGSQWIGWANFQKLFEGMYFGQVFINTIIIGFYKLITIFPASILLALLLNEVRRKTFRKVLQTILCLPYFISWVVLAGIMIEILSPSRGPLNYFIQLLGLKPIYFIADPHWFRSVLVGTSLWKEAGWNSIIFTAALSGIDPELYNVAEIDGAGRLRKIWNITLPSIMPVIVIMLIFSIGNIINDDFNQVFNLLNYNVMSVGDVISTYTYREGLVQLNFGYGAAVGLFKNIISLVLVVFANYTARKTTGSSIW